MKFKIFGILFVSLIIQAAHANDRAYQKPRDSFFDPYVLVVNGKEYRSQFFTGYSAATNEFRNNPQAFELAQLSKKQRMASTWLIWGGLGVAITYLVSVDRDDYNDGVYWGLFAAGYIPGLYYDYQSRKNLNRAITLYNREF